ncbi:MAG: phosphate signaling complex protein PhoU [Phycisphaerales bacterium]|nr:phosphate signaling complex protein PhoU [Phycisphaerales bacterium]
MSTHFVNLLNDLRRRSLRMASQVEDIVHEACEAVFSTDEALALRVIARDEEVDAAEVEVEAEVVRLLALYQPVGSDLRALCTILKVNNDLERVADCAVNLAERARAGVVQALAQRSAQLKQLCPAVRQSLRNAIRAYSDGDAEIAAQIRQEDQGIDALHVKMVRDVVALSGLAAEEIAAYLDLLSVAKNLERIADHATNIAEDVIFMSTGRIVRHSARG